MSAKSEVEEEDEDEDEEEEGFAEPAVPVAVLPVLEREVIARDH